MKDREVKTKGEIDELFFKPITESVDDMDINEKKEMKKIRPIKNTWYDWLINYIPGSSNEKYDSFKIDHFY